MTQLQADKPLKRETNVRTYQGGPLCIEAHPRYLRVWLKGQKSTSVNVTYEAIYDLGRKLSARQLG